MLLLHAERRASSPSRAQARAPLPSVNVCEAVFWHTRAVRQAGSIGCLRVCGNNISNATRTQARKTSTTTTTATPSSMTVIYLQ